MYIACRFLCLLLLLMVGQQYCFIELELHYLDRGAVKPILLPEKRQLSMVWLILIIVIQKLLGFAFPGKTYHLP